MIDTADLGEGWRSHCGCIQLERFVEHSGGDVRETSGPQESNMEEAGELLVCRWYPEPWGKGHVPRGGYRVRNTRAWLSSETSFTFACQARASGLLLDPRKSIENDSGFGSTPGDTKQFLLTLTPAVSAGGLSLTPRGARPESAPPGPEPV